MKLEDIYNFNRSKNTQILIASKNYIPLIKNYVEKGILDPDDYSCVSHKKFDDLWNK